jgi:hypothetical protein
MPPLVGIEVIGELVAMQLLCYRLLRPRFDPRPIVDRIGLLIFALPPLRFAMIVSFTFLWLRPFHRGLFGIHDSALYVRCCRE